MLLRKCEIDCIRRGEEDQFKRNESSVVGDVEKKRKAFSKAEIEQFINDPRTTASSDLATARDETV